MKIKKLSKKEMYIYTAIIIICYFLMFIFNIIFYDFFTELIYSKGELKLGTIVGFEEKEGIGAKDTYYSIFMLEDGQTVKVKQTYKDEIDRQVEIYPMGSKYGVRKDYEIKKMSFFDWFIIIFAPMVIWLETLICKDIIKDIRMKKEKQNEKTGNTK